MTPTDKCPFCASPHQSVCIDGDQDERNGYNFTVTVACMECGGQMVEHSRKGINGWCDESRDVVRERAVMKWNRRAA